MESLYCTPEINTILQINSISTKIKNKNKLNLYKKKCCFCLCMWLGNRVGNDTLEKIVLNCAGSSFSKTMML